MRLPQLLGILAFGAGALAQAGAETNNPLLRSKPATCDVQAGIDRLHEVDSFSFKPTYDGDAPWKVILGLSLQKEKGLFFLLDVRPRPGDVAATQGLFVVVGSLCDTQPDDPSKPLILGSGWKTPTSNELKNSFISLNIGNLGERKSFAPLDFSFRVRSELGERAEVIVRHVGVAGSEAVIDAFFVEKLEPK